GPLWSRRRMSDDPRVSELLLRWETLCEQGRPVPLEELCRDCPHLLGEVGRRVKALQAMKPVFQPPPQGPAAETLPVAGAPASAEGPPLPQVPGYEVERELGRGGMGVVYLARQASPRRRVALKMILTSAHTTEEQRRRFRAEAEAIARLQHPNIVS